MMEMSAMRLSDKTRAEEAVRSAIRDGAHWSGENESCVGERQEEGIESPADRMDKVGIDQKTGRLSMALLHDRALRGLLKRVRGYAVREVKTTYEYDASGTKKVKSEVVTQKKQGPDLAAITFVLTNIDAQHWRVKGFTDSERYVGSEALPDLSSWSDPELQELAGWSDVQNEG